MLDDHFLLRRIAHDNNIRLRGLIAQYQFCHRHDSLRILDIDYDMGEVDCLIASDQIVGFGDDAPCSDLRTN